MAQNTATTDRTDTERFDETVSADALIEGDRIDKRLVARHPSQVGEPLRRSMPNEPDDADAQLVVVTALRGYDDVHSALLLDPETATFVRATRHDSQAAWTQAEADWTVREVGTDVTVDDVHELQRPDNEQDEGEQEYVQTWVEILFDEIAHGHHDLDDERHLDGTTLTLNDHDGRKTMASICLEG